MKNQSLTGATRTDHQLDFWLFPVTFLVSVLVARNGFDEDLLHNFPTDGGSPGPPCFS